MVCSFILLILLMAVQVLIPAPRYPSLLTIRLIPTKMFLMTNGFLNRIASVLCILNGTLLLTEFCYKQNIISETGNAEYLPSFTRLVLFLSLLRWSPMVAQFIISGFVYFLLLLLTLGEEFKCCPSPLQSLCCWVHETKYARTVLMLTAITVNSVIASVNIVSLNVLILVILTVTTHRRL